MATDFTFIPEVAPRFGKNACWAYNLAPNPKVERQTHDKDRYAVADQRDRVFYKGLQKPGVSAGANVPLIPAKLGDSKTFDFNEDAFGSFRAHSRHASGLEESGTISDRP